MRCRGVSTQIEADQQSYKSSAFSEHCGTQQANPPRHFKGNTYQSALPAE